MRAHFQKSFLAFVFFLCSLAQAGAPLWLLTPDPYYPPTQTVTPINSVIVQYTITNQSSRPHNLQMNSIAGVTQITTGGSCPLSFNLESNQSCILTLSVQGSLLTGDVIGGPVVCEKGSVLQCYQPSSADSLHISLKPVFRYLITPSSTANGAISPNTSTTALTGTSLTFTALPDTDYQVDEWLLDGAFAQKGGSTFTLSNISANHTVEVSFTRQGTLFVGLANGSVYFSTNNGLTWTPTTNSPSGAAVNSLFATESTLYVASADEKVYYTTDNGTHWFAVTNKVPDGVNSVYVLNNSTRIYAGSPNGGVYFTDDNVNWTYLATAPSSINSLFITTDTNANTTVYTGNADGNVYYLKNNTWTEVKGPSSNPSTSIQNIFVVNNTLYVNTRHVSSNSTLPPGTVDFEYAYSTNAITANPVWSLLSQITYTFFVNSDASQLYAGTQNGHVFSLTTGDDLGFITSSPISSIFFFG